VFYPGTDRPETAEVLDMRGTRDVSGLTLTMKEEHGLSIEGTVTAETLEAGSPAALGLIIPGVPTPVIVATETRIGDPFRLSPVPPGSYLLFAAGTPTARALPPGAPPNLVPPPEPIMTAVPITLDRDSPIRDLTVTLPAGTPIEGTVEVDETRVGEVTKISPATGVTLYFEWLPKIESPYGILSGVTNDKGEFHFPGAVKGQEYIPGPRSDWGPFYVASFKQGQQDLAAGGLPVIAGGDPVHVLLKGDGGRIEGRVRDGANTPWRAFVVVAPRDRRIEFWFRTGYTISDGSFQIGNIPPGDYDIFAFDRNDEEAYYNADFLRRYGTSARPIRVEPYSVQLIDLSLTNTEK
jgi:hypothetical protein